MSHPRFSAAEKQRRFLTLTSFPHLTFIDIARSLTDVALDGKEDPLKEEISDYLSECEDSFRLDDYLRDISIQRHNDRLTITAKRFNLDRLGKVVVDQPRNHDVLFAIKLTELADGGLQVVPSFIDRLMNAVVKRHRLYHREKPKAIALDWLVEWNTIILNAKDASANGLRKRKQTENVGYQATLESLTTAFNMAVFQCDLLPSGIRATIGKQGGSTLFYRPYFKG